MSSSMLNRFVNQFRKDGVDHVLVSPYGETKIGRLASKEWIHKFFVPQMGEFTSPICFANWIVTGDDDARHNTKYIVGATVKGYLKYVLYGKYFQLCKMKSTLAKEMLHLPFACYKKHQSGVIEIDRWKEYPEEVKGMIEHVIDPERGPKSPYPWGEKHPGLEKSVYDMLKAMVGDDSDSDSDQPVAEAENSAAA